MHEILIFRVARESRKNSKEEALRYFGVLEVGYVGVCLIYSQLQSKYGTSVGELNHNKCNLTMHVLPQKPVTF